MIVLDASVVISLMESGHVHANEAAEIMDTEEELVLHPLTLSEILVGAIRNSSEQKVLSAIDGIGIETWVPDPGHARRIARLRAETHLKLPNACVLDTALAQNAALASFDERLVHAARTCGLEVFSLPQYGTVLDPGSILTDIWDSQTQADRKGVRDRTNDLYDDNGLPA